MSGEIALYCDLFKQSDTAERQWNLFLDQLARFDISGAFYCFAHLPDMRNMSDVFSDTYIQTNYDPAYLEALVEQETLDVDPYWDLGFVTGKSVLWSENPLVKRDDLSKQERKSLDLDHAFDMFSGVSIPFQFNHGLGAGGMGLHAPNLSQMEFLQMWREAEPVIRQLVTAFDIATREDHMADFYPLSFAEKECLLWLASGLRPQQIAYRLHKHPKTIEKQISSARRKLKADTVPQVVAKALIFGLVTP